MEYLLVVILIGIGIAMLRNPEAMWKFQTAFTVRGGEPTDLALIAIRVEGALFALVGAGVLIVNLVSSFL